MKSDDDKRAKNLLNDLLSVVVRVGGSKPKKPKTRTQPSSLRMESFGYASSSSSNNKKAHFREFPDEFNCPVHCSRNPRQNNRQDVVIPKNRGNKIPIRSRTSNAHSKKGRSKQNSVKEPNPSRKTLRIFNRKPKGLARSPDFIQDSESSSSADEEVRVRKAKPKSLLTRSRDIALSKSELVNDEWNFTLKGSHVDIKNKNLSIFDKMGISFSELLADTFLYTP